MQTGGDGGLRLKDITFPLWGNIIHEPAQLRISEKYNIKIQLE